MSIPSSERPEVAGAPSGELDVLQAVIDDHRAITVLMREFKAAESHVAKIGLAREIVTRISQHASAEERTVYPAIKEHVRLERSPELLYDVMVTDDQVNKSLLQFLDTHLPAEDKPAEWELYELEFDRFMKIEQEHFKHEETVVLPELASVLTAERKAELFRQWEQAIRAAPMHPHPMPGGSKAPVARALHPVAGAVDKAMHAVSGMMQSVLHPHGGGAVAAQAGEPLAQAALEGHEMGRHVGASRTVGDERRGAAGGGGTEAA